MMPKQSPLKRLYYAFLGRALSFAFHTRWRRFLGYWISSWIKFLTIVLFLAVLVLRLGPAALAISGLLVLWVLFSYWRAEKMGYNRFTADETAVPDSNANPLPPGQQTSLFATGPFGLHDRETTVLLRPAKYWFTNRGDHTVMVEEFTKKYVYQFFSADTLQTVQAGWLIFGKRPLPSLAITFTETWGPEFADTVSTYMVGGGEGEGDKGRKRTIYLTFEDTAVQSQVWHTIEAALAAQG